MVQTLGKKIHNQMAAAHFGDGPFRMFQKSRSMSTIVLKTEDALARINGSGCVMNVPPD